MKAPTEAEAREASRLVDAWLDERDGVTAAEANVALLIVDAYFKPIVRERRASRQAERRAS